MCPALANRRRIFGKSLGDYVRFERWVLTPILVVGLTRLGVSLAGVPNQALQWISITIVAFVSSLYCAAWLHMSGFGSYRDLLVLILLQNIVGEGVVIVGILIAILTGRDNIFTAHENGRTGFHIFEHVVAIGVLSILFWVGASLVLFLIRRLSRPKTRV